MESQQTGSLIKSFVISFYLVLALWVVKWVEIKYNISFADFGIYPRQMKGLPGIVAAPFIHSDLGHLLSNSFPLLITGTMLWYFFKDLAFRVILGVYILSGIGVWLFAREAYHIGASGVLYGLSGFLFFSGFFRRDHRLLGVSFLVLFLYGGLIWGMFPIIPEISWESHLTGAIIGAVFAFLLRNKGPQRVIYPIEMEEDEEDEFEDRYWEIDRRDDRVNTAAHPETPDQKEQMEIILQSTITCPNCGSKKIETMPIDTCQYFYECENCKTVLKPKQGDCCVFCSYGDVKCPSIQLDKKCC